MNTSLILENQKSIPERYNGEHFSETLDNSQREEVVKILFKKIRNFVDFDISTEIENDLREIEKLSPDSKLRDTLIRELFDFIIKKGKIEINGEDLKSTLRPFVEKTRELYSSLPSTKASLEGISTGIILEPGSDVLNAFIIHLADRGDHIDNLLDLGISEKIKIDSATGTPGNRIFNIGFEKNGKKESYENISETKLLRYVEQLKSTNEIREYTKTIIFSTKKDALTRAIGNEKNSSGHIKKFDETLLLARDFDELRQLYVLTPSGDTQSQKKFFRKFIREAKNIEQKIEVLQLLTYESNEIQKSLEANISAIKTGVELYFKTSVNKLKQGSFISIENRITKVIKIENENITVKLPEGETSYTKNHLINMGIVGDAKYDLLSRHTAQAENIVAQKNLLAEAERIKAEAEEKKKNDQIALEEAEAEEKKKNDQIALEEVEKNKQNKITNAINTLDSLDAEEIESKQKISKFENDIRALETHLSQLKREQIHSPVDLTNIDQHGRKLVQMINVVEKNIDEAKASKKMLEDSLVTLELRKAEALVELDLLIAVSVSTSSVSPGVPLSPSSVTPPTAGPAGTPAIGLVGTPPLAGTATMGPAGTPPLGTPAPVVTGAPATPIASIIRPPSIGGPSKMEVERIKVENAFNEYKSAYIEHYQYGKSDGKRLLLSIGLSNAENEKLPPSLTKLKHRYETLRDLQLSNSLSKIQFTQTELLSRLEDRKTKQQNRRTFNQDKYNEQLKQINDPNYIEALKIRYSDVYLNAVKLQEVSDNEAALATEAFRNFPAIKRGLARVGELIKNNKKLIKNNKKTAIAIGATIFVSFAILTGGTSALSVASAYAARKLVLKGFDLAYKQRAQNFQADYSSYNSLGVGGDSTISLDVAANQENLAEGKYDFSDSTLSERFKKYTNEQNNLKNKAQELKKKEMRGEISDVDYDRQKKIINSAYMDIEALRRATIRNDQEFAYREFMKGQGTMGGKIGKATEQLQKGDVNMTPRQYWDIVKQARLTEKRVAFAKSATGATVGIGAGLAGGMVVSDIVGSIGSPNSLDNSWIDQAIDKKNELLENVRGISERNLNEEEFNRLKDAGVLSDEPGGSEIGGGETKTNITQSSPNEEVLTTSPTRDGGGKINFEKPSADVEDIANGSGGSEKSSGIKTVDYKRPEAVEMESLKDAYRAPGGLRKPASLEEMGISSELAQNIENASREKAHSTLDRIFRDPDSVFTKITNSLGDYRGTRDFAENLDLQKFLSTRGENLYDNFPELEELQDKADKLRLQADRMQRGGNTARDVAGQFGIRIDPHTLEAARLVNQEAAQLENAVSDIKELHRTFTTSLNSAGWIDQNTGKLAVDVSGMNLEDALTKVLADKEALRYS